MADLIEALVNKATQICIASVAIVFGVSLWQEKKFSKKKMWAVILILFGIGSALKFLK